VAFYPLVDINRKNYAKKILAAKVVEELAEVYADVFRQLEM
jgi:hypothetical protein